MVVPVLTSSIVHTWHENYSGKEGITRNIFSPQNCQMTSADWNIVHMLYGLMLCFNYFNNYSVDPSLTPWPTHKPAHTTKPVPITIPISHLNSSKSVLQYNNYIVLIFWCKYILVKATYIKRDKTSKYNAIGNDQTNTSCQHHTLQIHLAY